MRGRASNEELGQGAALLMAEPLIAVETALVAGLQAAVGHAQHVCAQGAAGGPGQRQALQWGRGQAQAGASLDVILQKATTSHVILSKQAILVETLCIFNCFASHTHGMTGLAISSFQCPTHRSTSDVRHSARQAALT